MSIENPRQISTYQYPQQYDPCSRTISRPSLVCLRQDEVLLVSVTASNVGHATMYPDNAVAQTRDTMTNIKAVLAEANRMASQPRLDVSSLYNKVYVRHPAELAQIRAELAHRAGGALKVVYLQAHVRRQDLLLEIDSTAAHPVIPMFDQRS